MYVVTDGTVGMVAPTVVSDKVSIMMSDMYMGVYILSNNY